MSVYVFFDILDALPLPSYYKTKCLLDTAAHLSDFLKAANVQSTFIPSSGVLPRHLQGDVPGFDDLV